MSKSKLIVIIIVFVLLVAGGFWYFNSQKNTGGAGQENTFTNFFASFNPFAKITNKSTDGGNFVDVDGNGVEDTSENKSKEKFFRLSSSPVSGYTVFNRERYLDLTKEGKAEDSLDDEIKNLDTLDSSINTGADLSAPTTEFAPMVRYAEKITGNIYQTFADAVSERKYSSTVVKGVHETMFGEGGNTVLMRYLKEDGETVASYVGTLPKEVLGADTITANDLTGTFLPEGVLEATYSNDGTKMFYILPYKDGVVGITANADSSRKNQVFESSFTEWLIDWPNKDAITFTTKPASVVDGFMYTFNPNTRSFDKVLSKIKGLTAKMSPDGKYILFADKDLTLSIYNIAKKQKTQVSVKTLPEKCTWSSDSEYVYCGVPKYLEKNEYPDSWYQGIVSFSDDIWKIDVVSSTATFSLDPSSYGVGETLDMTNMKLSDDGKFLFFVDKNTDYLYEYKTN